MIFFKTAIATFLIILILPSLLVLSYEHTSFLIAGIENMANAQSDEMKIQQISNVEEIDSLPEEENYGSDIDNINIGTGEQQKPKDNVNVGEDDFDFNSEDNSQGPSSNYEDLTVEPSIPNPDQYNSPPKQDILFFNPDGSLILENTTTTTSNIDNKDNSINPLNYSTTDTQTTIPAYEIPLNQSFASQNQMTKNEDDSLLRYGIGENDYSFEGNNVTSHSAIPTAEILGEEELINSSSLVDTYVATDDNSLSENSSQSPISLFTDIMPTDNSVVDNNKISAIETEINTKSPPMILNESSIQLNSYNSRISYPNPSQFDTLQTLDPEVFENNKSNASKSTITNVSSSNGSLGASLALTSNGICQPNDVQCTPVTTGDTKQDTIASQMSQAEQECNTLPQGVNTQCLSDLKKLSSSPPTKDFGYWKLEIDSSKSITLNIPYVSSYKTVCAYWISCNVIPVYGYKPVTYPYPNWKWVQTEVSIPGCDPKTPSCLKEDPNKNKPTCDPTKKQSCYPTEPNKKQPVCDPSCSSIQPQRGPQNCDPEIDPECFGPKCNPTDSTCAYGNYKEFDELNSKSKSNEYSDSYTKMEDKIKQIGKKIMDPSTDKEILDALIKQGKEEIIEEVIKRTILKTIGIVGLPAEVIPSLFISPNWDQNVFNECMKGMGKVCHEPKPPSKDIPLDVLRPNS